jgi:transcription antitermination factor NusG
VNTTPGELQKIKEMNQVLSLVFWKGQPAIISETEMNSMKNFLANHVNVRLIRSKVAENEVVTVNRPSYSIEGNVLSVKNKVMKVNLPSLGFSMSAEIDDEKVIGRGISFHKRDSVLQ